MKINITGNADTTCIALDGRLDTVTAPELENAINAEETLKNLVLDLAKLSYISSAGLRVLLSAQKKMNKLGTMKVINVCDSVMEVFEITGFADVLVIE